MTNLTINTSQKMTTATIEDLQGYIDSYPQVHEWDDSYYSEQGLMLDINQSDKRKFDGIPSYAKVDCVISGEKYAIHYALKHGVPLEFWFHIKIKDDWNLIDIRELKIKIPMGETEDMSQLGYLSWAFNIEFDHSELFEAHISDCRLNKEDETICNNIFE